MEKIICDIGFILDFGSPGIEWVLKVFILLQIMFEIRDSLKFDTVNVLISPLVETKSAPWCLYKGLDLFIRVIYLDNSPLCDYHKRGIPDRHISRLI